MAPQAIIQMCHGSPGHCFFVGAVVFKICTPRSVSTVARRYMQMNPKRTGKKTDNRPKTVVYVFWFRRQDGLRLDMPNPVLWLQACRLAHAICPP
eukprot:1470263-Amphidinium_carterae.1